MILHILNGDCALKGFRQCNLVGEVLVWRENYLHGTIPELGNTDKFNYIRAEELHLLAPEKSVMEIFAELQTMHKKLFALRACDKLVLWLDCCPFDQALKNQLLTLIFSMPEQPELYLIQQNIIWDQEAFKQYSNWQDYPYTPA